MAISLLNTSGMRTVGYILNPLLLFLGGCCSCLLGLLADCDCLGGCVNSTDCINRFPHK